MELTTGELTTIAAALNHYKAHLEEQASKCRTRDQRDGWLMDRSDVIHLLPKIEKERLK